MIAFGLAAATHPWTVSLEGLQEGLFQFGLQGFLVAFDYQEIVRLPRHNLGGRLALAMHRVGRDDRACQVEHVD